MAVSVSFFPVKPYTVQAFQCHVTPFAYTPQKKINKIQSLRFSKKFPLLVNINKCSRQDSVEEEKVLARESMDEESVDNLGVVMALTMLKFYKSEISPLLPSSCRFVPTCSEYSMEAYKRYGVLKGTVLTAWRLCRCNPLGKVVSWCSRLQSVVALSLTEA